MSLILKLIRDNAVVNACGRFILKSLSRIGLPVTALSNRYRVYGVVPLQVCGQKFVIYARADDFIANEIFYDQNYEREEFVLLFEVLKRANNFVDVGANTGIYSIWAAKAFPLLNILAIEPHPANLVRLKQNITLNKATRIVLMPIAVGESDREIEFAVPDESMLSTIASVNVNFTSTFNNEKTKTKSKIIRVQQKMLDNIVESMALSNHDIIKIDVEYYELEVLKGAFSTLEKQRPMILIELLNYDWLISTFPSMQGKIDPSHAANVYTLLKQLDYYMYSIGTEGIRFIDAFDNRGNGRNFLFSTRKSSKELLSYNEISELV